MIDLNIEREAYVKAGGKVVLKACPGSGKTTTIAYKLYTLINNEYNRPGTAGIACLSFTNIAKDEIKQKYLEFSNKTLSYPHIISTLDSFINTYITLPFYYLISGKHERPVILDENSDLDSFRINELWNNQRRKYKHLNKEDKALFFIYKPSSIVKDVNGNYTTNGNIPDPAKVDLNVFIEYAKTIKTWQLAQGILTNSDSTVLALSLLNSYPHITKAFANRFDHIIVDEAQDTSEIQHSIFDKLIENGLTKIELIGDPHQSLYMWRNAKPKVFTDKYSDPGWQGLDLSDNWRSTQTIINTFSILRNPADKAINARKIFKNECPVYVLHFEEGKEIQALQKYEELCKDYKENQVVTRGADLSDALNGRVRDNSNYWKNDLAFKVIHSVCEFKRNNLKVAIDNFRWVAIELMCPKLSYKAKKEKFSELKKDYGINAGIINLLAEFSDFSVSLSDWTNITTQRLTQYFGLNQPLNFELKQGLHRPAHKKHMSILYADELVKWNFSISTIHKVKGKSLDTILLFLHKNGHSISIADLIPAKDNLTENQTMIYVAMSRPRHLLAIAIEKSVAIEDITRKLGDKIQVL